MSELLDIFDENYNPIEPFKLSKEEIHKKGFWHHTFHCWVIDENSKSIFFQLNMKKNNNYKPVLTPSSAGHIQAGERIIDGIREIKEELGIEISDKDLVHLFTQKRTADHENFHDREFIHVYVVKNFDTAQINLDPEEVKGFFNISLNFLLNLFEDKEKSISNEGVQLVDGLYLQKTLIIGKNDFVEQPEGYYKKIAEFFLKS